MSNKSLAAVLLLSVLVIAGVAILRPPTVYIQAPSQLGSSGDSPTQTWYFRDGAYVSAFQDLDGSVPTLNASPSAVTSTARTLTSAEVCQNNTVDMVFNIATGTLTFPSAANLISNATGGCLTKAGSVKFFNVRNASSSSTGLTYAAGASSSIVMDRNASTNSTTTALGIARFTLIRVTSSSNPWVLITQTTY